MDDDVADSAPASEPAPPPVAASDTDALIERWWAEHFPGSPVARFVPAWNHALAAKDALKRLLAGRG